MKGQESSTMKVQITFRLILISLGLLLVSASAVNAAPVTIELSPQLPTTQDSLEIWLNGFNQAVNFDTPRIAGNEIILSGTSGATGVSKAHFLLSPLAIGDYTIQVVVDGSQIADQPVRISAPSTELDLLDRRFVVITSWIDPQGVHQVANAIRLSDNSGYFWFFSSGNMEVTIKILDGRPLNGHFWVFIASMTDLQFSLSIYDPVCLSLPAPCNPLKTYDSPRGRNMNFIDLSSL
jgi:hypothetical protein